MLPGTIRYDLAKRLHVDIVHSGRRLITAWTARITDELPPLQHLQEWIQAARNLEKEDDLAQITLRRAHTGRMLAEDLSGSKTNIFKRSANKNPTPAGFFAENSERGMCSHPQQIHETLQKH